MGKNSTELLYKKIVEMSNIKIRFLACPKTKPKMCEIWLLESNFVCRKML
jgi:hypothetical protein